MTAVFQSGPKQLAGLNGHLTEISPTHISTDLFSPDQKSRITIPAIGYQVVKPVTFSTGTWGEHATGYGGIGKLLYLDRVKVKEIDIPRSHKHYGSGFAKYETSVQPYRHTPLVLSACRINDQILPPCFKENLEPSIYNPYASLPRPWKYKYNTHVCQHDVFPRHDQSRTHADGQPLLTGDTRKELEEYYNHLYYIPQYSETFPNRTEDIKKIIYQKKEDTEREEKQRAEKYYSRPKPPKIDKDNAKIIQIDEISKCLMGAAGPRSLTSSLLKLLEDATLNEIHIALRNLIDQLKDTKSIVKKEECFQAQKIAQVIEDCLRREEEGKCDRLSNTKRIRAFLRILNRPPSSKRVEAPLRSKSTLPELLPSRAALGKLTDASSTRRVPLAGIGSAWPPSNSQVMDQLKMKLKEVEKITVSSPEPTDLPCRDLHGKYVNKPLMDKPPNPDFTHYIKEWMDELSGVTEPPPLPPPPGLPSYHEYLNSFLPIKLRSNTADEDFTNTKSTLKRTRDFEQASIQRLPPLSAFLKPTGNRIQDRLGISFKHEAQRRYHALYPEAIPDLRDSEILKQRYFFYGHHASDFRG